MEILESWLAARPRLWRAWCWANPCKGEYADGTAKPEGPLFRLFHKVFHLQCSCCSAIRGLAAGFALGFVMGALAWQTW